MFAVLLAALFTIGASPGASVVIHPQNAGMAVAPGVLGAGMDNWTNLSGIGAPFVTAPIYGTRFPAGAQTDIYNWQTGTDGPGKCAGNAKAQSTLGALISQVGGCPSR